MSPTFVARCKKCGANMWCTKIVVTDDAYIEAEMICLEPGCGHQTIAQVDLIGVLEGMGIINHKEPEKKRKIGFRTGGNGGEKS